MKKLLFVCGIITIVMALTSWTTTNQKDANDQATTTLKSSNSCFVHCTVIDGNSGELLTEAYWKKQGDTRSEYVNSDDASFETEVSSGTSLEIGCDGYSTLTTSPITTDQPDMTAGLNSSSSRSVVVVMTKK